MEETGVGPESIEQIVKKDGIPLGWRSPLIHSQRLRDRAIVELPALE